MSWFREALCVMTKWIFDLPQEMNKEIFSYSGKFKSYAAKNA